jgi:hypothetical protein
VDGLDRPTDLEDLASPAFSWQLPAIKQQSAYRIVVSSTAALAAGHEGDVWDSGKVTSTAQTDIAYAGPALEASKRYYWTVRVWDGADAPLDFAEPSWFGTSPGSSWQNATPIWSPSPTANWTDYTVTAKLNISAVAVGIRFRAVDANNSYMWQFRGSDNRLTPHKQTSGTYATLGNAVALPTGTLVVGTTATIKIQVAGSTITTFINDVQVDQRTDSSFASGLVGVRTGNSESGTLDDLSVVSAGGATLFSDDFSGTTNSMGCGTVGSGVLTVPVAQNCLLAGYGNDWVMARKDVQVEDKPIAWASLFATGTDWSGSKQYVFKAAIDGTFVGLGPTAPVGSETRFDGFDVTSLLTPGKTSTISMVARSASSNARLLAQLQIQYADGTRQVVGTDGTWKTLSAGKVFPSSGSYGTSYFSAPREDTDLTRFPTGYDKPGFDASSWTNAETRSAIASLTAAPMAKVGEQLRDAAKVTKRADGDYVIDFGRSWMGGISWEIAEGIAGSKVQVKFGQVLNTDGSVKYQTAASNTYLDTVTTKAGAQHLETWGMRTFRYVEVVNAPEEVTAASLKALALVYPFDEEASTFDSSSTDLNKVYALSKNTIEATNLNFYTDSYERERTNYEADAYLQLMSSLYLMDDLSLGRYSMNYFKTNRTWPTEWPVYVVLAVHDAWRQTGNTEQVADYFDNLATKLPSAKWFNASTGLIGKSTGSNGCNSTTDCDIVDWPTTERDGYTFRYYNTVINAISYAALVDMSAMAKAIGRDTEAESYASQAAALRTAINAKFYNAATGSYDDGADVNGTLTGHAAVQASAFALAFGVPADDQRAKVASYVASKGMVCSVYCAAFLVKGLYDGGQGQAALNMLTTGTGDRSWLKMIEVGAGATMEAWNIGLKSNTSYSHPWAASPAFNVPSGLFGIKPLTAGYGTVGIKPTPGDLAWGTIKTPTVRGSVGAAFSQSGAGTTVVAAIPGNTRGTVSVPTAATAATVLYVDGVARTYTPADGYVAVDLAAGCHVLSPTATVDDLTRLTEVCASDVVAGATLTPAVSNAGADGWYADGAQLTLTPAGETVAGAVAEYRLGDGQWTAYEGAVALGAGSYDVDWRLRDGDETIASGTVPVKVDTEAPVVEASVSGRRVTLTATDAHSGVGSVEYRLDGGAWTVYTTPVGVDSGAHTVTYRATDVAGNVAATGTAQVLVAPSASAMVSGSGAGGWLGGDASFTLAVTGAGAAEAIAEYRLQGGDWVTYTQAVDLPAGVYDVDWRLRQGDDVVGSGAVPVKVDLAPPTVGATVSGRTVTVTATDAASGVASVEYRLDGGAWAPYGAPVDLDAAAHTVEFSATDVVGNASEVGSIEVEAALGPVATTLPTVTGSAVYGTLLRASAGRWDLPVTTTFQWLRNGSEIKGATAATYLLGAADLGKRISVRVSAKPALGPIGTATSAVTAPVQRAAARTTVKVAKKSLRRGQKEKVTITVTGAGAKATGQVRITRTGAKAVTKTLRGGSVKLSFVVRKKGRGTVTVQYLGSGVLAPGTKVKVVYKVK